MACLGVMYPQRKEVVQAMLDAGLKVAWGTGLVYEAYRDVYHNSRISLCISAHGDVAQRVFETGAMGCVPLLDATHDLDDPDTNRDFGLTHFARANKTAEFVAVAQELLQAGQAMALNTPAPAEAVEGLAEPMGKVAAAIFQAKVQKHSWDERAKVIVAWYQQKYGVLSAE